MRKTIGILPKIPQYKLFRKCGFPVMMPLNLTASITYRCNSRCKTCNVWKKKADELRIDEFDAVFKSIGNSPYWLTISGGEPFLRSDIVDICRSAYIYLEPDIINIPTNGILYDRIPEKVEEILENCRKTHLILNLSIDGIGEAHDNIRNVKDNFEKAMKTYDALRSIDDPGLSLGIHTVISRYNVNDISRIYEHLTRKNPDSYITEIAEERVELDTIGCGITPSPEEYKKAIDFLTGKICEEKHTGLSKMTQAFRLEYYDHVKKVLRQKRQIIPCYAGFASSQIAPDGDVWTCCIRADPVGNLRDAGYDFKKVWSSCKARKLRDSIKNKECCCPLANAHYTNMLCDLMSMIRVGIRAI